MDYDCRAGLCIAFGMRSIMGNKLLVRAGALLRQSRRPRQFERDWRVTLSLGSAGGILVVLVILGLEPWGTEQFQVPMRVLKLSGYGLAVLLSFAAVHAVDILRLQIRRIRSRPEWRLGDELISWLLLFSSVAGLTCIYHALVIDQSALSWSALIDWTVQIMVPMALLLAVPIGLLQKRLLGHARQRRKLAGTIVIRGRNMDDRVRFRPDDFVCAEAQQNYVALHYLEAGQSRQRLIRATLREVEQQLPGALRVHRSWLINPMQVEQVTGNQRQRRIRLSGVARAVPVSGEFDLTLLQSASSPPV